MRHSKLIIAGTALALSLAACGSDDADTDGSETTQGGPNVGEITATDLSDLEEVAEIAELVPDSIKSDGKLVVGANIFYAPAEFYAADGVTPQGYDIDLANALAKVMGLEADIQQSEFASIIPAIGTKYEIGISNFTITAERQNTVNMIQYFELGSGWGVPAGNDSGFDPADICGSTIGVQTGTYQDEILTAKNQEECADNPIQIQKQDEQSRITLAASNGQIDAMYADSSVVDYAVSITDGQIESVGEVEDLSGVGIVLPQDDEWTEATRAATQYLMDEGYMDKIFETWGITEGVSTEAVLNPAEG